jgi:hypothetical protein
MNVYKKHGGYPEKIIEGLSEQEAIEKEIKLIKEYKMKYSLTNITDGGEGVSGLKHSTSTKEKLSELSKKQWTNSETRKRLIEARRKGHNTPTAKANFSKANKGKVLKEEHKMKIRKSMSDKSVKEKMAKAKIKYTNIRCVTHDGTIKLFENTKEAVEWLKETGVKITKTRTGMSVIIGCLTGRIKTAYGYHWFQESE